jgi:galactarate dehydratase (D-threo-forming)
VRISGTRFHLVETPRETGAISEHLLVRVETDEGLTGWGEWSDLAHGHPANFPNFPLLEEEAARRIAGADPLNIARTMDRLTEQGGLAGGIPVALEMALFDLQGKLLGVPVSALLGGRRRDRIPFCYPIFPLRGEADVEPNIERVRRLRGQGFTRIRKYIGTALDAEERFFRELRDAFGQEVEIKSLDLSARFYWQDALALLERFKPYDYQMAESVSRDREVRGMAEVRRRLGLPISEHLGSYRQILEYAQAEAIDVCNLSTCGLGIRRAKALFDFAHGLGLRALHGTTQELSVGTAAAAHVCAAIERVDLPCDPAGPLLYTEDCTRERVRYEGASLLVPEGPGLGVQVDEEHLEEIAYKGTRLRQLREGR